MKHLVKSFWKELKKHPFDYLILIAGGVFFLLFLKLFGTEKWLTFTIVLFFTSAYILWGIYHHIATKTLHLKNVIEYILIGFIILFLVETILF